MQAMGHSKGNPMAQSWWNASASASWGQERGTLTTAAGSFRLSVQRKSIERMAFYFVRVVKNGEVLSLLVLAFGERVSAEEISSRKQ